MPDDNDIVRLALEDMLSTDEGRVRLTEALLTPLREKARRRYFERLLRGPDVLPRPEVERQDVERAIDRLRDRTLGLMQGAKGPGAFVSIHEALGKLTEEVREVEEAVHQGDPERMADEMLDVAVIAVFTVACESVGVFDDA